MTHRIFNQNVFRVGLCASLLIIAAVWLVTPHHASADCIVEINEPADVFSLALNDQVTYSSFSIDTGNTAAITVTNNTECDLPLALASYKVFNQNVSDQEIHRQQTTTVPSQSNRMLHVNLPDCMSQIDLVYDPDGTGAPNPPIAANPNLIGWTFQLNEKDTPAENDMLHFDEPNPYHELDDFPNDKDDGYRGVPNANRCGNDDDDDDDGGGGGGGGGGRPLSVSCQVTPQTPQTGETVSWEAVNISGGSPPYSFLWSGDISGTSSQETASYEDSGIKSGQIKIQSGEEVDRAACTVSVQADDDDGDDGGGTFRITASPAYVWMVANSPLPSTATSIRIQTRNGFNQAVTITARGANGVITHQDTKFTTGSGPVSNITVPPHQLGNEINMFVDDSVEAATYPITVTAVSEDGDIKTTTVTAYSQFYAEF